MALLKENKNKNKLAEKKNQIHRKGEASILFDFSSFHWLLGATAPRPPLHLLYILCIMADNCFHFHSCVRLFQGDEHAHMLFL